MAISTIYVSSVQIKSKLWKAKNQTILKADREQIKPKGLKVKSNSAKDRALHEGDNSLVLEV